METDIGKYISAVIEGDNAQSFLDGQGDSRFEVDNELLVATAGHVDLRAIGSGLIGAADEDVALRPGAVEREAAKGIAAAGKESLAERHAAIGERLSEAQANASGPDDVVELLAIDRCLGGEFGEVNAGAKLG